MDYRFSQLFDWCSGKADTSTGGDIPIYGSNGVIGYTSTAKYYNKIILGRVGAYCGSVEYCAGPFSATDNTLITTCDESKILYQFAYYLLKHFRLNDFAGGSAQPLITQSILRHLHCNIPEISQQKFIANVLSSYDNLIENNNKRIAILEQMAENLYKEWFVRFRFPGYDKIKFENGLPVGWPIKKIKNCVRRLPFGRLYKAYELQSEGRIIVVDQSTEAYLGFHDNTPSHFANYDAPIILFGDHTCKFQLMCKDFSLGENVVPFVASNTGILDNYYLYYAMRKLVVCEEYKRHWNNLINLKIFVPPMAIQRLFAEQLCIFEKEKEKLFRQNLNLTKQRNMLLPRLINGTLEIKL